MPSHLNETPGYAELTAKRTALQAEVDANGWTAAAHTLKKELRECLRSCAVDAGVPAGLFDIEAP